MTDEPARVAEEPRRAAILDLLRQAADGLTVDGLAAALELHPNTIRWHLGRLAGAGLVASRPVHRSRPGRPSIVYEAVAVGGRAADDYRFLSEMLASAIAMAPASGARAEEAGRAWGGHLVDRPAPASRLAPAAAVERIVELLDDHGFAPTRVAAAVVEMHRCPFRDLVDAYGDVVCGLHRGLLAGALDTLGAGVTLDRLDPYPAPGVCRAHLAGT